MVKVALFVSVALMTAPSPRVEALISTVSASMVTPFNPTLSVAPEALVLTFVIFPS